jgi:hypothetical protein
MPRSHGLTGYSARTGPEHGLAFDSYAVGLFDGAQANGGSRFADGGGFAVASAHG